jgi:hypothetical protein
MKLLLIHLAPISCYFLCLGPKHSPYHPVLKHPEAIISKVTVEYQ